MAFGVDDYDPIRPGMVRSAATVVPEVMRLVQPTSVVDVGCGQGVWLAEFARFGCNVKGFDGHDGTGLDIAVDDYEQADLSTRSVLSGRFDLAVCLEVAEHLPETRADWLVYTLCCLAPVVLFSAAVPGQGGQGHVNEQWPGYWAERFNRHAFRVSGELRWKWWNQVPSSIEPWYAQNLLLCVKDTLLASRPLLKDLYGTLGAHPHPLVHPIYRGTWSAS